MLKKAAGARLARRTEHLFRRSRFHDTTAIHEDDAMRHLLRERHFMGDDEHGHVGVGQIAHDIEDFANKLGIERRCRFIEEHDVGLHGERAGNCHALLLSARQLVETLGRMRAEMHPIKRGGGPLARRITR